MKCKNIECNNETTGKRVYCSLTCINIYVNKYLRDYNRYKETCENKKKEREIEYKKNPKHCKNCNEVINFEKNENESFCSHSCRASYTNGKRDYSRWADKISESLKKYYNSNKKDGRFHILNCEFCSIDFKHKRKNVKFCSKECLNKNKRKNMDEYKSYKIDTNFKFNLGDFPDEFDFKLVEKYGWYSPTNKRNNLKGVSRDHMLSVRGGFEMGIDPKIISHPANCRLMIHNENISKNKKSSITYEELLERIKTFEEKYKK